MDLRPLLPWSARWILRTTPFLRRESDGQIQEDFSAVAGPSRGECATRTGRGTDYCLGGDAVWGADLLGHGGVWTSQGRPVAAVSSTGAWDSQPRHLQPRVPPARARGFRSRVP